MPRSHGLARILLLIAAIAAAGWLISRAVHAFAPDSPITAFLTIWLTVAVMAAVALSIPFPLPSRYYEIRAWENDGRIYEHLGICLFKKMVRRGPLSIFSRTFRLPNRAAVLQLEKKMRSAEAIHVYSSFAILPLIGYSVPRNWWGAIGCLLLFNFLVNGYPIMLQRYNRIRLHKLFAENRLPAPHFIRVSE